MSSGTLTSLAGMSLLGTIWLAIAVQQPGLQLLLAVLSGAAAYVTVRLTVAAVRADLRERAAESRGVR